jgi:parallel beta-helix repeat protein
MRKSAFITILLGGIVLFAGMATAVERHVPSEYATIQAAINACNNGDTVLVAAGTYYENISMKNGVTVTGAGAAVTTIDGGGNGHVVVFNLASGTISGFTITNSGHSPLYVGGIFTSQCNVRIENNIIVNNNKGIILSSNSSAVIAGNQIINNTDIFGRGIELSSSYATITNNVIAGNSYAGIYCDDSSPLIVNNTIYDNGHYGIRCNPISTQVIFNNIITHNEYGIMAMGGSESPVPLLEISYNDVWNNSEANYWYEWAVVCYEDPCCVPDGASEPFEPQPGTGEISTDPLFANPDNDDYHLKSTAGRWNPNSQSWVTDAVTSPCIDAGNPGCPLGDEPSDANNVRINMGAYGGTAEASKTPSDWRSIADLTNDWAVDFNDLGVFVGYWLDSGECIPGDLNRNQSVDFVDYAIFAQEWQPQMLLNLAPSPVVWEVAPYETGGGLNAYANMSAQVAIDPEGLAVQYYFECVGHEAEFNSGWINNPQWQIYIGPPGQGLSFHFKARDTSPDLLESVWSTTRDCYIP